MRRALVVLVLALTLAACETSNLQGSAAVSVSGRLLRADGSPAAGVPVGLERGSSLGDLVGGALFVPLTLLTACLADPPPEICRGRFARRTTTAADGSYSFALKGKDTQSFFGNAVTMSVSAEVAPGAGEVAGPAIAAEFRIQTEVLRLPDLQLWQPRVTVATGKVRWEPLAGATSYQVGVEDAGAQPVWAFDARGTEVAFDPRILEDTTGSVAVSVGTGTTAEGTKVSVVRRSARVAYRSAAGPAPSRGRPCTLPPAAGRAGRCPYTDGDFSTYLARPSTTRSTASTTAPSPESATIELSRAVDVSLVVVRGCSCEIEQSVDGQAWTVVGRSTGYSAVVPSRTGPARFVRVTGSLLYLREVSVWDAAAPPTPTAPPPPGAVGPPPAAPPAPVVGAAGPRAPSPSRTVPALLALGALLLAAVGTSARAARARR